MNCFGAKIQYVDLATLRSYNKKNFGTIAVDKNEIHLLHNLQISSAIFALNKEIKGRKNSKFGDIILKKTLENLKKLIFQDKEDSLKYDIIVLEWENSIKNEAKLIENEYTSYLLNYKKSLFNKKSFFIIK